MKMPVRTRIRYWLDIPSTDKTRTKLTIFRDCPRCQHEQEVFSSESHGVKVWTHIKIPHPDMFRQLGEEAIEFRCYDNRCSCDFQEKYQFGRLYVAFTDGVIFL